MSINIDTVARGDRVLLGADEGEVTAVDLENNEITVEVVLANGATDTMTVDCGESWLVRA